MLVDFQIFDDHSTESTDLIYDSNSGDELTGDSVYQEQEVLFAYGRNWTIQVGAREDFRAQFDNPLDWMVPALGSGISLSVFVMMLILLGRRESAQHLANIMIEKNEHASERFHQQLSDVLSAASEVAIITTDKNGIITIFNTGAERLLGYQAEELIAKSSPAIFHDLQEVQARSEELTKELGMPIDGFRTFVAIPERNGSEKREWTYIHKLGYTITVTLVVTPIRDSVSDEITGYLGMAEDITERKRVEHLKSEFVSTVSHELRTPLTAISGALKLIASGMIGPINEKTGELLTIAVNNTERLAHLVNDLLDFEKITGGQLQFDFQVQPLKPLIERALASHQTYCIKEQVRLSLSGDIPDLEVSLDAQRFMQVLANLISNAIKFSPTEGQVSLSVEAKEDRVRLIVSDQGPGIPMDFERRIFERFAQADSSDTRQKGGTGLGLAISKELIEGMHGHIGFYNNPNRGASFWIELPLV
jgi:PAS domain S-box-containing protein